MKKTRQQSDEPYLDYEDLEEEIEELWELLESEKFHFIGEKCQNILEAIEKDFGDDFGQDVRTATLYDDPNKLRRERYLEVLHVYQRTLRGLVIEIIVETDDIKDIDRNSKSYPSLRKEIQDEMYKVAYLLGDNYESKTFITQSDLEELDELWREHCQLLLKREFFKKFKIVIQTLGSLNRKNFHKVTEPYKNLRNLCGECLEILDVMKDSRFFGENDTFIEDYENDVKIYLQILWYLAIKTDLNKADKFLNPNTYTKGLDEQCQVFAAIALMEQVVPHLEEARNLGLSNEATTAILEEYTEYLYKIITHEEARIGRSGLHQLQETDRILSEGGLHDNKQDIDLSIPEDFRGDIEASYCSLEDHRRSYGEMLRNETEVYIRQEDKQEFDGLLEKAARGVGVQEVPLEKSQDGQKKIIRAYRYEFKKGSRDQEPVVFMMKHENTQKGEIRLLHKEWVEDLYVAWKEVKKLDDMKTLIKRCTKNQKKIKYRLAFAFKFFRKTWFAFRLREHKLIAVPNPEGRVLRQEVDVDHALDAMKESIFFKFFEELKMRYRSRYGVKLQKLRWAWFAERELKEGYFKKPKYNYLKYIHTRWKKKVKRHYKTLRILSKRNENDD